MKTYLNLIISIFVLTFHSQAQTGIDVPQFNSCDALVDNFMQTYDIPGATFAIAKDGKLVYHKAFGHADAARNEMTLPHHLFRIASISKPITSIAIMKLMEENQLSLTDKVFGPGGILENHAVISNANITDQRIYDITVQHLLEHSAGWNSNVNCFPNPTTPYPWHFTGCDPIVAPLHVTQTLGTTNPSTEEDMIVFLLEKGLNFTPNTAYAYSNIGYLILGEIIAELSNSTYENYVKDEILSPLGICDMHLGKNLLEDKMEREGEYTGNGYTTLSCYNNNTQVPWEYGGFNLEAMGAHGGWIATTRDLVQLLLAVDGFSTKPDILNASTIATMTTASANNPNYAKGWSVNSNNHWWHLGSLDGTSSLFTRTSNGYTWVFILNKRVAGGSANQFNADFDNLPWNCIANVSSFPTHDLLDIPLTNSQDITFSDLTNNSVTASWTNGTGNKRVLAVKAGSEIKNFPLDGISYNADASFSAGDDLGDETFVVYDGIENHVSVTNLQPHKEYVFRVFDYNQSSNTGNNKLYKLCGNLKATITTTSGTSVQEIDEKDYRVKVYPTITSHVLNVSLDQTENASYQIYNTVGQLIIEGALNCQECLIHLPQNLNNGLYLIKFNLENNATVLKKFIVK